MSLDFSKYSNNLIPTIVQHAGSGKVLMLGFSSKESLEKTKTSRLACFFSRSRKTLWTKGETSGNTLDIQSISYDCDNDSMLFRCIPNGPTCHTGNDTCFFTEEDFHSSSIATTQKTNQTDAEILWSVYETVKARKISSPENSYVASLYADGLDRIAQKVGEEAIETVIAAKNDDTNEFVGEFSDLLFHMMVLLAEKEISLHDIVSKFNERIK